MSNETLFYICGGVLAASAVTVSLLGLKLKNFPGKFLPAIILWFAVFVLAATAFATRYSGEEHEKKAAEYAKYFEEKEAEEGEASGASEEGAEGAENEGSEEEATGGEKGGGEAGTTLQVEASPTALAFNTTELEAEAGEITIDFKNPSAIAHNVVIEQNGKELAGFEPIAEGEESETANLKPGTYTFLCTVPGHAAAGMEGTLVVK